MGKATYTVTVTNNSNGVSVDYETETPMTLLVPEVAAEVIKDLVNTVRSYDTENEHDVCGGFFMTILLGIVGAVVGGWISTLFGFGKVDGFNFGSFVVAVIGAIVVLFIYRKIKS